MNIRPFTFYFPDLIKIKEEYGSGALLSMNKLLSSSAYELNDGIFLGRFGVKHSHATIVDAVVQESRLNRTLDSDILGQVADNISPLAEVQRIGSRGDIIVNNYRVAHEGLFNRIKQWPARRVNNALDIIEQLDIYTTVEKRREKTPLNGMQMLEKLKTFEFTASTNDKP